MKPGSSKVDPTVSLEAMATRLEAVAIRWRPTQKHNRSAPDRRRSEDTEETVTPQRLIGPSSRSRRDAWDCRHTDRDGQWIGSIFQSHVGVEWEYLPSVQVTLFLRSSPSWA